MNFGILSSTLNMKTGNVLHPFLDNLSVLYAAIIYPCLTSGYNSTVWIDSCAVNSTFSLMANYWTEHLSMLATKDTVVMPKQKYVEHFQLLLNFVGCLCKGAGIAQYNDRLASPDFHSWQRQGIFLFYKTSRPSLVPTHPCMQWVLQFFF